MYGEPSEAGLPRAPHGAECDRLDAAVGAMRRDPAAAHTVSTLARCVGMSRSNFAEAFRARFSRSPMEMLRSLRLERAAELLRDCGVPIKSVGARVGYSSRTSFSQAFRNNFGMSPVAFRSAQTQRPPSDIHAVSRRLRSLSGRSQELAWEVELRTGKVWWSEGTLAALGFKPEAKLISDVARFYDRIHPEDRARVVDGVQSACVGSQLTWQDAFRFKTANGAFVPIRNGSIILREPDGAATRLIGVMQVADR
ncbi:MAG: helix-turn-helix domain-containing protein [Alphaproteobacteria bacterium]|nr:helix-turn-helix domain-containing protein [Alphaproteobacteria bacterium]